MQPSAGEHWNSFYAAKQYESVSWFEDKPTVSKALVETLPLPKDMRVVDAGCGQSYFVDDMIEFGCGEIYVIDASGDAINALKQRIGTHADRIKFVVADIGSGRFLPQRLKVDLWHDRAAFHFLISPVQVGCYLDTLKEHVIEGGYAIFAEYSKKAPDYCSGLPVRKYDPFEIESLLGRGWILVKHFAHDHVTPSGSIKNFNYCVFRRLR